MQVNTEDKTSTSGYQEDVRVRTQDNTHEIVSKVAYLIGVLLCLWALRIPSTLVAVLL